MARRRVTAPTWSERLKLGRMYHMHKMSAPQIATELGLSERHVYDRLKLHQLTDKDFISNVAAKKFYCSGCGILKSWLKEYTT